MGLLNLQWPTHKKAASNITWRLHSGGFVTPADSSDSYIDQGYKMLPNLYGLINLITKKSSSIPHKIFREVDSVKAREYKAAVYNKNWQKAERLKVKAYEEVFIPELEELLAKPNDMQDEREFNQQIDGYLLLTGNSFILADMPIAGVNKGRPKQLHGIPSPVVEIIPGTGLDTVKGYQMTYFPGRTIDPQRMGHIKYFNPITSMQLNGDSLYGMSPLKSCRNLLGRYHSADIAQGAMFKNMGPAGILSETEGILQPAQIDAMRDRFRQMYRGEGAAGEIAITSANVKWEQIGLSPVDLNIIEAKKEMMNEIMNVYNVPIALFTENNSTDNNMTEAKKMFITDAVIPIAEHRKSLYNRWILPAFGDDLYLEYDYSTFPEMQEDLKAKWEWVGKMWQLTPNQQLTLMDQEESEDPLMDKHYVPSNLIPLEEIGLGVGDIDTELLEDNPS